MISKTKIAYAEQILGMLEKDKRNDQIDVYVEMFENCREQGYRIITYEGPVKTIAFSENRNSDEIVVYYSPEREEHAFGYSDTFWRNSKYFRYDKFDEAVNYIFELLGVK